MDPEHVPSRPDVHKDQDVPARVGAHKPFSLSMDVSGRPLQSLNPEDIRLETSTLVLCPDAPCNIGHALTSTCVGPEVVDICSKSSSGGGSGGGGGHNNSKKVERNGTWRGTGGQLESLQ